MEERMFISRVEKTRVKIGHIPALVFEPIDKKAQGHIIHYHGWGSKKENHSLVASALAAAGFMVLVPDGLYHGERGPFEEEDETLLPDVILSNLREFPLLSSYLKAEKLYLTGHSMGSMSAGVIFHQEKTVDAAIIINGYLSYKDLDLDMEVPKELLEVDPIDFLANVKDRHLLILHGDADSSVDIKVQRKYVKKAQAYYKPGHLIMEEIPSLNHYVTVAMLARMIDYLSHL